MDEHNDGLEAGWVMLAYGVTTVRLPLAELKKTDAKLRTRNSILVALRPSQEASSQNRNAQTEVTQNRF
jgi:hypothetical protein